MYEIKIAGVCLGEEAREFEPHLPGKYFRAHL